MPQARAVAEKFRVAFELFGKCHCTYNSATLLSDNDIDELSKSTNYLPVYVLRCHYFTYTGIVIDNFMAYYRSTFPEATVTPKMHIMEDHITQFLQMWRVGFGFHGEQGAESLHALIRRISRSYGSIPRTELTALRVSSRSITSKSHLFWLPRNLFLSAGELYNSCTVTLNVD